MRYQIKADHIDNDHAKFHQNRSKNKNMVESQTRVVKSKNLNRSRSNTIRGGQTKTTATVCRIEKIIERDVELVHILALSPCKVVYANSRWISSPARRFPELTLNLDDHSQDGGRSSQFPEPFWCDRRLKSSSSLCWGIPDRFYVHSTRFPKTTLRSHVYPLLITLS